MVTFALVGFLLGWLWTRLYLPGALRAADVVKAIAQDVLDKQQAADAKALALVNRVLAPPPGAPPVSQEEATEAIKAASPPTQVQIFERARGTRLDCLERAREAQKAKQDSRRTEALASMERTALYLPGLDRSRRREQVPPEPRPVGFRSEGQATA